MMMLQWSELFTQVCADLGILDSSSVREALENDEKHIFLLLQQILSAKNSDRKAALNLQGSDVEGFMDVLQMVLSVVKELLA